MGYYTEFEIHAADEVIASLGDIDSFAWGERLGDDPPIINSKWYSWEEDLVSVSAKFPQQIIEVRGWGEEAGDAWVAIFKNGKKTQYQKFDWSMLQ